jgi:glyceraldehyde 3-phosphate dehydrogenase
MKIAINGFGRIGRMVFRAFCDRHPKDMEIVAINDLAPFDVSLHLLKYDSVHGKFAQDVTTEGSSFCINGKTTPYFSEADPLNLPWEALGVDIVFECSGHFTSHEKASLHIKAGAKRVIISAPSSDADITTVYGANHTSLSADHKILSNASCTTNCLVPVAKVLDEAFKIQHGYMTTIHSYTGDQRLVDTCHKDLYRSRAAALSMIPTTTGAAKALGLVLPSLKGRLDGTSIRVPTPNVSLVDFTFTTEKKLSVHEINEAMIQASQSDLKGILAINTEKLVSIDFNKNPHSSIFDCNGTQVMGDHFGRIMAWYDNEWGFSNRMIDLATFMKSFC